MVQKKHVLLVITGLFLLVSGGLYAQTPQDLNFGSSSSGNLRAGGEQWFRVRPTEVGFVTVEVSSDFDSYLEVYDASNNLIAENDDGADNLDAKLEVFCAAGSTYLFKLRGYSSSHTGAFRVWATFRPIPPATELRFGSSLTGNLTSGGEQWYIVRPSSAGFLTVETSGSIDTYLSAFDASNNLVVEDDDGGEDTNARLGIFCAAGAMYRIRLRGYSSSVSGSYRIWASFEDAPQDTARNTERSRAVSISLGEATQVYFQAASESRWYRYDIPRNGTQFVVQTRGDLDTRLYLYDARGNLITDDDDSGDGMNAMVSQRLDAGTVYIELREYYGRTGRCTLHAEIR